MDVAMSTEDGRDTSDRVAMDNLDSFSDEQGQPPALVGSLFHF